MDVVRRLTEAFEAFNVYTVRDGKVTRMEFFTSREPAERAAGLREREDAA